MGQKQSKSDNQNKNESDLIEKTIDAIFGDTVETFTVNKVIEPILFLSKNISVEGSFKKT
jgi:hypothetical protein